MSISITPEHVMRARQLVLAAAARNKLVATIQTTESGEIFALDNGYGISVQTFAERIAQADQAEWAELANQIVRTGHDDSVTSAAITETETQSGVSINPEVDSQPIAEPELVIGGISGLLADSQLSVAGDESETVPVLDQDAIAPSETAAISSVTAQAGDVSDMAISTITMPESVITEETSEPAINAPVQSTVTEPPAKTEAEILRSIRTRLIPLDVNDTERFSYARKFPAGILQILCEDTPEAVKLLTAENVAELNIPLEKLYEVGQANTDAEPISRIVDVDDTVRVIEGESFFIAAKAGNMRALVDSVIGPAPHGVVFGIPNRGTIVFALPHTLHPADALIGVTQTMDSIARNPEVYHPGGLISSAAFYWSPDDTIDVVGCRRKKDNGEETLSIVPSEAYEKYCPLGSHQNLLF
ncbi:hypothetical protein CMUST_00125 [Corynebacterium mustelae]|uniref:Uncharacterized protein n=1 Tax=Corynebacterium mustelae TaxID=571915 RepID=A0A0G3GTC9_9CORY|nr:hypothetical protein [Corynebacterium mustelae]AKK04384.1 hypothetical protein CMUST_00125 [Corynebacterium mustelae]